MHRVQDRDEEAARNIEWARKGITSVAFGSSRWNTAKRTTDAGDAFRNFSKKEMEIVRGCVAEEVQKDLRAVHWNHGFQCNSWESEAMRNSKIAGATVIPDRCKKDLTRTQFKLGDATHHLISGSKSDHRKFTKTEVDEARAVMADSVKKDLRAVHVFAPYDEISWKSEAMNVGRLASNQRAPQRYSKDLRSTHIYLGGKQLDYTSDSKAHLREFSKEEMEAVRGSMAKEIQADLRAVHFTFGTDKGVLDRDIADRLQTKNQRAQRPQSAPLQRRRPLSAIQARN